MEAVKILIKAMLFAVGAFIIVGAMVFVMRTLIVFFALIASIAVILYILGAMGKGIERGFGKDGKFYSYEGDRVFSDTPYQEAERREFDTRTHQEIYQDVVSKYLMASTDTSNSINVELMDKESATYKPFFTAWERADKLFAEPQVPDFAKKQAALTMESEWKNANRMHYGF